MTSMTPADHLGSAAPSFWHDDAGVGPRPRAALPSEIDVAIVGARYTGLWTAYYLAKADPPCA